MVARSLFRWASGFGLGIRRSRWPWRSPLSRWLSGPSATPEVAGTPDQNVLLITIDTLRADALGCAGGRAATPNLDRLASLGTRYSFAHAHAVVTLPSHATILTGLYPFEHGVHDNAGFRCRRSSQPWRPCSAKRGTRPARSSAPSPSTHASALNAGFDVYDDKYGKSDMSSGFRMAERRADAVVAAATGWIAQQKGRWFAWVHVFDPHAPYRAAAPLRLAVPRRALPRRGGVRRRRARPAARRGPRRLGPADARHRHRRPRRSARRARRVDSRPVRLRADAADPAHPRAGRPGDVRLRGFAASARQASRSGVGHPGPARGPRAHRPRRAHPRAGPLAAGRDAARGRRREGAAPVVLRVADDDAQPGVGAADRRAGGGPEVHRAAAAGAVRPALRPGRAGEHRGPRSRAHACPRVAPARVRGRLTRRQAGGDGGGPRAPAGARLRLGIRRRRRPATPRRTIRNGWSVSTS